LRHRVYHLASGIEWSGAFTQWCGALRGAYPRFSWRTAVEGEDPNVSFVVQRDRATMDIRRLVDDTGFSANFGPADAYEDYIRWIPGHEAMVAG
jgi:UDP-glucuronate 4-epimerase